MTDELKAFRGEAAEQLVRKFDNEAFQASLDPSRAPLSEGLVELKLSAMLAYEEWLEPLALFGESFLASFKFEGEPAAASQAAFDKWHAYLAAPSISRAISVRDLLLTAASGLAAQRQTDLRYLLCREEIAACLTASLDDHAQWPRRVQDTVSRALLLIVRQAFRSDLDLAQGYVTNLKKLQAEAESAWLREATHPAQTALSLLALYHCAQATSVLSRYFAEGELPPGTGHSANVRNELRVLLGKAEEYANLSSDPELVTWTRSVIMVSLAAVADSIWDNGRNITATIALPVQNALPLWVRHSPPPEQPAPHKPQHNRQPWKVEELAQMDDLLKAGKTPAQIAIQLSRSEKAVLSAIYRVKTGEYFVGPPQ